MNPSWIVCSIAVLVAALASAALAQQTRPTYYGTTTSPVYGQASAQKAAPASVAFKPEELQQILAPVALYPDALLSQVLMASTYPAEVVQADRWAKQNKAMKADALAKMLEAQPWDPSVKSLVNFPDVLGMMSEKLDLTVKLGDAFIAQQKDVMDTVQALRTKAQAQGNLKSTAQQNVIVEAASATQPTTAATTQIIRIESADPQVIYVPTYNPTVVYGTWAYPTYPPYYYYPPPPSYSGAAISFGVGLAVGAAWGYAWGGCDWHGGDVDIDIDRNVNINNTHIDRDKYRAEYNRNRSTGTGDRSAWQHDASHRKGVAYRDQTSAQRFGGASSAQAVQARDAYRGRAETGRQDIARGGADAYRSGASGGTSVGGRDVARTSGSGGSTFGGSGTTGNRTGSGSYNRPSQTGTHSGAFDSAGGSGNATRSYSQRGQTSRSGGSYGGGGGARPAPARSAPARGGGGGGRRR